MGRLATPKVTNKRRRKEELKGASDQAEGKTSWIEGQIFKKVYFLKVILGLAMSILTGQF